MSYVVTYADWIEEANTWVVCIDVIFATKDHLDAIKASIKSGKSMGKLYWTNHCKSEWLVDLMMDINAGEVAYIGMKFVKTIVKEVF